MFDPVATYRIQFHKDFTFTHLEDIIPYLQKLGVHTLYASPIFEAVPGSTHGYDVLDPHKVNPEIGTLKQLRDISKKLKAAGIAWLQDIVPNHMAFDPRNKWLMDVLEKGERSAYARFFDMAGASDMFAGRVMVPFLGSPLEEVIANNELKVIYADGRFQFDYYDSRYPIKISSYDELLSVAKGRNEAVKQFIAQARQLPEVADAAQYTKAADELLLQLAALYKNYAVKKYIDKCIATINADDQQMQLLADAQHYRLCSWKETDSQINFRRFFTVNGLICLNIHYQKVFDHYHKFIKTLLKEGVFDGLRVDHIDGLYDPAAYLQRLRKLAGDETYVVVEKILEKGEQMPGAWPIQGNTGYDFLAVANNLFTYSNNEKVFEKWYSKLVNDDTPVEQQIWTKKAAILFDHMGGELNNLYTYLKHLQLADNEVLKDVGEEVIKKAIAQLLIEFPVYRYYGNTMPLLAEEQQALAKLFKQIRKHKAELEPGIDLLENIWLKKTANSDDEFNRHALLFYQRCMQFAGPLMAKGVEDTLMYTYNRFIGHNEVGDAPDAFGISADEFHQLMLTRQKQWPLSINGTSTHDTKRGEDVRARLNVLTAMGDEWLSKVDEWRKLNDDIKTDNAPNANDEYLLYQTIAGAYPMPGADEDNFGERLQQYIEKALREAKLHTGWAEPNEKYETAVKGYAARLLDKQGEFWQSFEPFYKKIAAWGVVNSLAQVVLKFTAPGVPDVYQGCERWDLSLVDPDNRRPVDYELSNKLLEELSAGADLGLLWSDLFDARIKLWLTQAMFKVRRQYADLLAQGEYLPLKVKGRHKEHVIAFARRHKQTWLVVVLPLHLSKLTGNAEDALNISWGNTRVLLPAEAPDNMEHLLTGKKRKATDEISVKDIFTDLPLAVLKLSQPENDRGSGILMHITSLPSRFGVGDMGSEAKNFAQFLSRSRQKYWQLLPLSPTGRANGFSPYSAFSTFAGNTLLISPELLVSDGLLAESDLKKYQLSSNAKADLVAAEQGKTELFDIAWRNFNLAANRDSHSQMTVFFTREAYWLDDFALYIAVKQHQGNKPWYEWDEDYRLRDRKALDAFARKHKNLINKVKWLQFVFAKQWNELKEYCNGLGIQLFGDLPFYVSYDSADVWANRDIFSLDDNGAMKAVAGVPPDYFNADGQLWGMPVFCWEKLKEQNYKWWVDRIRRNTDLFDLLRLDHFRAFSAYWEVPAGEQTAKNGKWQPGPGSDIFHVLKQQLGELPFVAEDLGDIDEPVYQLRDEFAIPGMKVLQFAFGDEMALSDYIPHNYNHSNCIAYTGTHDNNTTRGWYRQDADKALKKQLEEYTGAKVREKNVHEVLTRLAMSSIAKMVIVPVQDVLGLDESARMNTPASVQNNWLWRMLPGQLTAEHEEKLRLMTQLYNRA